MNIYGWPAIFMLAHIGAIIGGILLVMAYYTYAERKVLGAMQRRQGPMTVGPFGLLQPIADGIKLLSKETIIPSQANKTVFLIAPMLHFLSRWLRGRLSLWMLALHWLISTLACFICSPSLLWVCMALSWRGGHQTQNTRFWGLCAPPPKWCLMKCRWGLSLSPLSFAQAL